jgi:pilus assembly protein CpaB
MKPARLAVLGIAIVAGGLAAYLASGINPAPPPPAAPTVQLDTVDVLVAKNDIGVGQAIAPDDLQWQTWPTASASSTFLRKSDRPDAIVQLTGAVARMPFAAGEPLREDRLIKANGSGYMAAILPSGARAISTEISPETGAGGFILPNDRVDVILTRRDREAEKATGVETMTSQIILVDVRVLAIDQTVEEKNGQRVVVGKTATLELAPHEAERLARARQQGTIQLALRSLSDSDPKRQNHSAEAEATARINMIRFGVPTTIQPF